MLRPWLRLTGLVAQQFVRRLQVADDPRFAPPTMELEDSALSGENLAQRTVGKQSGQDSIFETTDHDIRGGHTLEKPWQTSEPMYDPEAALRIGWSGTMHSLCNYSR